MHRRASLLIAFLLLMCLPAKTAAQQPDIINTFAGGGPNNLLATSSNVDQPTSVAVDAAGATIYIAGWSQNCIFKVDLSTDMLTIYAGNGTPGYNGDNIPAASALLTNPTGIALDSAGDLYIADTGNERIRKIDTSGMITTVAGNGSYGFLGDDGPATSAEFARPYGMAVDSFGNLFVADIDNERIRMVSASTGYISTVAGNGSAGFAGDGGPAIIASLKNPTGVAVDSNGNLYIADGDNFRVRRVDQSSGVITTFAGGALPLLALATEVPPRAPAYQAA